MLLLTLKPDLASQRCTHQNILLFEEQNQGTMCFVSLSALCVLFARHDDHKHSTTVHLLCYYSVQISEQKEEVKKKLRERRVPSSAFGRAAGFAGMGASLVFGSMRDSVSTF